MLKERTGALTERLQFRALPAWESTAPKGQCEAEERGEKMLVTIPTEFLDGLLSGLEAQSELSALLEELYYQGLS